ncbi:MAG: hypothetical protein DIU77_001270 [Thermocrispum agreste]|uniref:Uncharacterized protein n=2 Tax=Thermocrispum agreste TaxID=37925 RepID=A0ABD6FCN7_9PSEU
MPSSLIIVALAVAWLVVLVPMVVRKRQEIAETGEDALASRVVRAGSDHDEEGSTEPTERDEDHHEEHDEDAEADGRRSEADDRGEFGDERLTRADVMAHDYSVDDYEEPLPRPQRRYRPGRGGFDPHAAELAARAKYAFRQRVVLTLLLITALSAIVAAVLFAPLWWLTGTSGTLLAGYLVYLRRQVRIENEIRQRRMARLAGQRSAKRRRLREEELDRIYDRRFERDLRAEYHEESAEYHEDYDDHYADDYEVADEHVAPARPQRRPRPEPREIPRNAVVVDVYDEDPAFHELAEPDERPFYRRAVGE